MNRFQAMAQIMAILAADGRLKQGSREYKLARDLVSRKIESLGADAALAAVKSKKAELLKQIEVLSSFDESGRFQSEIKF